MFINIVPVPKPRMTQRDRWAQRPAVMRYYAFCDEIRLKGPGSLPPRLRLIFYLPMPKSWPAKKRTAHEGLPHQVRPDTDNLTKAVKDALAEEDSYIYDEHATKYWAATPGIFISSLNDG